MKNLCKLLMVLFLSITMSGCGSAETKEQVEENAKEIFKKTFELYRSYNGYQTNIHRKYTRIFLDDDKLAISPVEELNSTIKEVKKGNAYYEVEIVKNRISELLHQSDYVVYIKEPNYYQEASFEKTDKHNVRLLDVQANEVSNEGEKIAVPFLYHYYTYFNDYSDFFDFEKEISGDKIIIKITCNDVKGFSDYVNNEIIAEQDDISEYAYDPYVIEGIKVSKNEIYRECKFILDKNYNLLKIEDLVKKDYGDGLTTTGVQTTEIDQINKLDMNTEAIESLLKKAETAITGDGTIMPFKMKNDIDWDFQ